MKHTRTLSETEKKIDEKMSATHTKKMYSFTEEEKRRLEMITVVQEYQRAVYTLMEQDLLKKAVQRIGRTPDLSNTLYSLEEGIFIVYEPKAPHA